MPTLRRQDGELTLNLSGADDFQGALNVARGISPRRFDGDRKLWVYPEDAAIAERILLTLKPHADDHIVAWVRETRHKRDAELTTTLPKDADLLIPWGDKLFPFQRACVHFIARHPHLIEADDMGLGKSLQALSGVYERLLYLASEQNGNFSDTKCDPGAETRVLQEVSGEESGESTPVEQALSEGAQGPLEQDDSGREKEAMRGLREGRSSAASNGLGSRSGQKAVHVRELSELQIASGNIEGRSDTLGASEVRSALSNVPSVAALASRPKLVICPNSAKGVWAREIEKWLGTDEPYRLVDATTPKKREAQILEGIKDNGWVVVNYEQIRAKRITTETVVNHRDGSSSVQEKVSWEMKQPIFADTDWLAVIADECHRAKNYKAQTARGLWRIQAPIQLALSGTPLMNHPAELWSVLRWLYPEQYHEQGKRYNGIAWAYWPFYDEYVEDYDTGYGKVIVGVKNPDALRFELKDRLVRRTKKDHLNLPEKVREIVPVKLNPKQQKLYDEAESDFWIEIQQAIQEGDKKLAKEAQAVIAGQKRVIEMVNGAARTVRLRQVASTPALLGGEDDSAKLDAVMDFVLDGPDDKQWVVFTEFVDTANILVERLRAKKIEAEAFTGEVTDTRQRTLYEDRFQRGEIQVLVGTIGAMRESITLTAADTVIFVERAWVPGWNEQAEDRLWRNGQDNQVTVLILEAAGTVDEDRVKPTNAIKEVIVSSVIKKDEVRVKEAVDA